ncbi:hypothetical protein L596_014790 [Steinernema carpocapsae]|uniref:Uncharacterized protein n=1 Tax=Steinernema carpocapsae TaxID=34508 RepID=A0A4U5NE54_STECR|nr:hypothetical protein L596_014790 [Steinernema carpocapsae]
MPFFHYFSEEVIKRTEQPWQYEASNQEFSPKVNQLIFKQTGYKKLQPMWRTITPNQDNSLTAATSGAKIFLCPFLDNAKEN